MKQKTIYSGIMALAMLLNILSSNTVQAQDQSSLEAAFSNSYKMEVKGEYEAAIKGLQEVYSETSYQINLRLGWLHYLAGLFTESLAYYQKTITLMPYAIEAKLGYVYPAAALGNWEQVMKQYKAILTIDPQNTTANYRMGSIYYGRKDYATAFKYLEKVVNLYPFDYNGVVLLAWTNYQMGRTREAKILFQKALLISPGDASATEGLGLIK